MIIKTSFREQLNSYVRVNGTVSYQTLKDLVETGYFGGKTYKVSNMERRLRHSESPNVEAIMSNGAIKFYKWLGAPVQYREMKVLDNFGNVEKVLKVPML